MARVAIGEKVVNYLPAQGWVATYDEGQRRLPIACWALTNEGAIVGVVFCEGQFRSAEDLSSWTMGGQFRSYEAA